MLVEGAFVIFSVGAKEASVPSPPVTVGAGEDCSSQLVDGALVVVGTDVCDNVGMGVVAVGGEVSPPCTGS